MKTMWYNSKLWNKLISGPRFQTVWFQHWRNIPANFLFFGVQMASLSVKSAESDKQPQTCWVWMTLCHQLDSETGGDGRGVCVDFIVLSHRGWWISKILTESTWPKASRQTHTIIYPFTYKRHPAQHGNFWGCWFRWMDDEGGGQIVTLLVSNMEFKILSPAS